MNKYHSQKVTYGGEKFDSNREFKRWCELLLLEKAGRITNLKRQVKFELIPTQREASTDIYKAGPQKGLPKPGVVLEKPCTYVADFAYYQDGKYIVEDAKGCRTEVYKIKKKLMLWVHGIRILET